MDDNINKIMRENIINAKILSNFYEPTRLWPFNLVKPLKMEQKVMELPDILQQLPCLMGESDIVMTDVEKNIGYFVQNGQFFSKWNVKMRYIDKENKEQCLLNLGY